MVNDGDCIVGDQCGFNLTGTIMVNNGESMVVMDG